MKLFLTLSMLLSGLLAASALTLDDIKRDEGVLVLTKDNFEVATKDTQILVEFCKSFAYCSLISLFSAYLQVFPSIFLP